MSGAALFIAVLLGGAALLSWPLGRYFTWAMAPDAEAGPIRQRLDGLFERIAGHHAAKPRRWKGYATALLGFNAVMFALAVLVMSLQQHLPLNPDRLGAIDASLIFNTAASFTTNTNLQHYSGEATLSYLTQLTLMWLQFVSAATGIAALTALARGLTGAATVGSFFVDVQRATFLVLLPLAAVVALLFVLGGMPMTLSGAARATTLEGATQTIARGPVAAFVAIKQLGTN
ncbi:MAG: potassium-transporting ATPase subunit KdpA, partial [Myxococcales bacterium]|nr:potassium-transporting ATPase subunit KdpA [Myxococcales bacterium]